jgi:hypothetical protein
MPAQQRYRTELKFSSPATAEQTNRDKPLWTLLEPMRVSTKISETVTGTLRQGDRREFLPFGRRACFFNHLAIPEQPFFCDEARKSTQITERNSGTPVGQITSIA